MATMCDPLVTAIVLNWNGAEDTVRCIEHVLSQSYSSIELIVVDNASVDGSRENIRRRFPDVRMVENEENLGYATGMNQGIDLANGDYLLLLNQDALIRGDFIENAVRRICSTSPRVGMLAAKVYRLDGSEKTDKEMGGGLVVRKRFQFVTDPDRSTEHYTLSPNWCCPFLRMEALNDVRACSGHCFDDRYFAYGEDLDLALRAQLLGWRCLFSPDLVAWHSHSGSLGGKVRLWEKPPVFRTHALRNRYTTMIKDLPLGSMLCLAPFIALTEIMTWPFFLFRSPSTILCLMRAYMETIQTFPGTLRLRRKIQAQRRVSARYLQQFFVGF